MNVTQKIQFFTYNENVSINIDDLAGISNTEIISIFDDDTFLSWVNGLPEGLQNITELIPQSGYFIASKDVDLPYELYPSEDDIPSSVTISLPNQFATYCGSDFSLVGITITSQPSDFHLSGTTASFSVEASVVGDATLTYQWEYSIDDGQSWGPISNETNSTLNLSGLDSNDIGTQYRVIVGATGADSVTSNAVSLTVPTTTTPTPTTTPAPTTTTTTTTTPPPTRRDTGLGIPMTSPHFFYSFLSSPSLPCT